MFELSKFPFIEKSLCLMSKRLSSAEGRMDGAQPRLWKDQAGAGILRRVNWMRAGMRAKNRKHCVADKDRYTDDAQDIVSRHAVDPQFDLFVPFIADLPLRDQRETMERPFFSLAKRKRLEPKRDGSPDGMIYVNVFPNPEYGMATIWDADVLIWAASTLNAMKKAGKND